MKYSTNFPLSHQYLSVYGTLPHLPPWKKSLVYIPSFSHNPFLPSLYTSPFWKHCLERTPPILPLTLTHSKQAFITPSFHQNSSHWGHHQPLHCHVVNLTCSTDTADYSLLLKHRIYLPGHHSSPLYLTTPRLSDSSLGNLISIIFQFWSMPRLGLWKSIISTYIHFP